METAEIFTKIDNVEVKEKELDNKVKYNNEKIEEIKKNMTDRFKNLFILISKSYANRIISSEEYIDNFCICSNLSDCSFQIKDIDYRLRHYDFYEKIILFLNGQKRELVKYAKSKIIYVKVVKGISLDGLEEYIIPSIDLGNSMNDNYLHVISILNTIEKEIIDIIEASINKRNNDLDTSINEAESKKNNLSEAEKLLHKAVTA